MGSSDKSPSSSHSAGICPACLSLIPVAGEGLALFAADYIFRLLGLTPPPIPDIFGFDSLFAEKLDGSTKSCS